MSRIYTHLMVMVRHSLVVCVMVSLDSSYNSLPGQLKSDGVNHKCNRASQSIIQIDSWSKFTKDIRFRHPNIYHLLYTVWVDHLMVLYIICSGVCFLYGKYNTAVGTYSTQHCEGKYSTVVT